MHPPQSERASAHAPRGAAWSARMPEDLPGAVRQHLARCERCRKAIYEMLALAAEFERLQRATENSLALNVDDLTRRVMAAIRTSAVPHPAAVARSTAGTAHEAAPVHVEAGRRRGSLLRDMLVLAGLAGAAFPAALATSVAAVVRLLDARAALSTPLLHAIGLLLRPAVIALRTLGDLALDGVVGIVRIWGLASSVLLNLGAAPVLILVAFTLAMGLLLATLLARSGLDEASAVG